MGYKNAAAFDTLRSVAAGSITTSYAIVGDELSSPAVIVGFVNNTNAVVLVSTDGINDMVAVPATSGQVYDFRTNAPSVTDYLLPQGTPIMVKYSGSAPDQGSFYITVVLAQI